MATIPDMTLVVKTIPLTKLLKGLAQQYERAQAEQDKAFTAKDHEAEGLARGVCLGLVRAVQVVAELPTEADAVALLDTLEPTT